MKLSAILVSVNLVAAMPVAAQAAENAVSDKADWIKSSLAAIEETPKPQGRKLSLADTVRVSKAPVRAFVPNRHLPSKRDLEHQLIVQQARMDLSRPTAPLAAQAQIAGTPEAPLTGQVSAYAIQVRPVRTTPLAARAYPAGFGYQPAASKVPARPAQRAIAGQPVTLPGQIASTPVAAPAVPVIPEPPAVTARINPALEKATILAQPAQAQGERVVRQAGGLLVQAPAMVQPPSLTPEQQSMLDELVEMNKPGMHPYFVDIDGSHSETMDGPGQSALQQMPRQQMSQDIGPSRIDPGPPPFPLNLLPPDALKELIHRGRGRKIMAPVCHFGSWHGPAQASAMGGFRSYARPSLSVVNNVTSNLSNISHLTTATSYGPVISTATRAARRTAAARRARKYSGQPAETTAYVPHARVLMYAPYQGYGRTASY